MLLQSLPRNGKARPPGHGRTAELTSMSQEEQRGEGQEAPGHSVQNDTCARQCAAVRAGPCWAHSTSCADHQRTLLGVEQWRHTTTVMMVQNPFRVAQVAMEAGVSTPRPKANETAAGYNDPASPSEGTKHNSAGSAARSAENYWQKNVNSDTETRHPGRGREGWVPPARRHAAYWRVLEIISWCQPD